MTKLDCCKFCSEYHTCLTQNEACAIDTKHKQEVFRPVPKGPLVFVLKAWFHSPSSPRVEVFLFDSESKAMRKADQLKEAQCTIELKEVQ